MTNGPIEFLGEESRDEMPNTEYGGTHGVIQPEFVNGQGAHEELSASEIARAQVRYGNRPLPVGHQMSGTVPEGELVVDPASGRVIGDDLSDDVTGKEGKGILSPMGEDVRKEDTQHVEPRGSGG